MPTSKIFWFNLIVCVLGVIEVFKPIAPPEYIPYFVAAVGVVNVILRVWFNGAPVK